MWSVRLTMTGTYLTSYSVEDYFTKQRRCLQRVCQQSASEWSDTC